MARSVWPYLVAGLLTTTLAGCGVVGDRPKRPAWRDRAEQACIAQKLVRVSSYVQPRPAIDGPGICGLTQPFKVAALSHGAVTLNATGTLNCPMIAALDKWVDEVVQPAARARFGQPVVAISSMGSYGCRAMNHQRGAKLSEHAFGNALDIGAFRLADGREIVIAKQWTRGDEQEKAFLRDAHAGACDHFTTVLGPGYNALHYNHFHVDLAMHGNTSRGLRRYCRPTPRPTGPAPAPLDTLPDPPMIEPDLEIARRMQPPPAQPGRAIALAGRPSRGALPRIAAAPSLSRTPIDSAPLPPMQGGTGGGGVYGRLPSLDAGAPPNYPQQPRVSGMMRDDGVFVPPDDLGD